MYEHVIKFLSETNAPTLLAMAAMLWFFYSRLDKKMKDLKYELKDEIKELSHNVMELDKRLCRIEGSLATQGHCLFHQKSEEKKAE
jgi:hypothetical protein